MSYFGPLLVKALVPFVMMKPHDLITSQKAPPPNTSTLEVSISTYEFQRMQLFRDGGNNVRDSGGQNSFGRNNCLIRFVS
jgi:hypothetical protein